MGVMAIPPPLPGRRVCDPRTCHLRGVSLQRGDIDITWWNTDSIGNYDTVSHRV